MIVLWQAYLVFENIAEGRVVNMGFTFSELLANIWEVLTAPFMIIWDMIYYGYLNQR